MTGTENVTIAELAAQSLAAVRVFEKHGIDYCCGGKRLLADVCRAGGHDLELMEREIETALKDRPDAERDWANAPLGELIDQVVNRHHGYLRRELPAIQARLDKVYRVYNQRYGPTLVGLPEEFATLRDELEPHMEKEEAVLFPAIRAMAVAANQGRTVPQMPFGSVLNPIRMMEAEHEHAGAALANIRTITNNFEVPFYACVTYKALMTGLSELERDLHLHVHLENNVLFPRAVKLEAGTLAAPPRTSN